MIVAIDGPAGAGKSTGARALADTLGLALLDTGAMYRGITWKALELGIDIHDGAACSHLASEPQLRFDPAGIQVDGVGSEAEIRSREVDQAVSIVAAHPLVRAAIVPTQREVAGAGAVAEGRDTTTVVFPGADHRFFLLASPEERARRRCLQRGDESSFEEVLDGIRRRDHLDSTREDSPLKRGEGVIVVDTDGLNADEVAARLITAIRG